MGNGAMLILTGAPGSGKSAVVPELRRLLSGVVVIDMDEFFGAGSRLAGVDLAQASAAASWRAYNDLCLTLAATVLAAGHDVLLLSPLTPAEVDGSAEAPVLGPVRWAVLDCSDATRRRRLSGRSLEEPLIEDALCDAARLRALGLPSVSSDTASVEATARAVAVWARTGMCSRPG